MFRVTRPLPSALALGLAGLLALAGCGGDDDAPDGALPDDAIARVGDTTITKAAYDEAVRFHQMRVTRALTAGRLYRDADAELIPLRAPFTACIAAARQIVPASGTRPKEPEVRKACEALPQEVRADAVQQLVSAAVFAQQAKDDGVTVTDDQVEQQLGTAYEQQIDGRGNLAKLTRLTGLGDAYIRGLVRQTLTYQALQVQVVKDAGTVSDADVRAAYDRDRELYDLPFQRVRGVLRQQLEQTRPQEEAARWQEGLVKTWQGRTTCRAGYVLSPFCPGGPSATPTSTTAEPAG